MFKKKSEKFEEDFNADCELALQVLREEKESTEQYEEEFSQAYIKLEKELEFEKSINGEFSAMKKLRELEQENADLKALHESDKNSLALIAKKSADLEKELEISRRCWQDQKNISLDTNCKLHKAKEIIKTMLGFMQIFGYSPSMDKFVTEAEQFIKE